MTNHKHYDNFFGYLAHVFTTNTPLSLIILFSSIILGLLAYWITPKQYNPEVIRPAFVVATEYRGADANEVHDFVSQNIVHDMRQIDGVDEVRSQSFSGGYSMVSVLFDVGENEEASKTKIFTKILENTDIQKEGIGEPSILSINPDDVPIVTLDISSPRYDQNHIREIIFAHIDALETIPGVSDVHVYGGEAPALRIELDKGRMQTLGVSLPEVLHVLESHNKKIFTTPISTGYRTIALELDNHISSAEDLRKIAVRPDILMSDISYVSDTYQEKNSFVELNNRGLHDYQNVFISFAKKKGTSAPQVSRAIQTSVSSIFDNQDIEVSVLHDDGHIAQNEINGLMYNLLMSIFKVLMAQYHDVLAYLHNSFLVY